MRAATNGNDAELERIYLSARGERVISCLSRHVAPQRVGGTACDCDMASSDETPNDVSTTLGGGDDGGGGGDEAEAGIMEGGPPSTSSFCEMHFGGGAAAPR